MSYGLLKGKKGIIFGALNSQSIAWKVAEKLFDAAIAKFGKIDFILHSIGMSVNVRKGKHYTEMNYDWLEKGWDVSAVSFHKVMRVAWEKDCMNEWGSILALSYIAAQRTFPDYNDMADKNLTLKVLPVHSVTTGANGIK